MFKSIFISGVTTISLIILFMIGMTKFIPNKEPIKKLDFSQVSEIEEQGGKTNESEGQVYENSISTSAVVGLAVENRYANKFTQKLGNNWSVGTGFIVDSSGYVITNYHVINGKKEDIYVTLYGGDTIKGRTVWANADLDVAVIKIEVAGLPTVTMGDSKKLKIGEPVTAIGNPLGFEFQRTVTGGIVSGLNRSISINGAYMEDLIQTDASINPGNSGGPLVNRKGEVIGINTVKVESAEGIGFAIPVNQLKPIIQKIKTTGEFKEPYFGIVGYDREMISNIDSNIRLKRGIFVYAVEKNSPAEKAGIKENDIILSIDDKETNTLCELREELFMRNINDAIKVTTFSDGENVSINVNLGEKNKNL